MSESWPGIIPSAEVMILRGMVKPRIPCQLVVERLWYTYTEERHTGDIEVILFLASTLFSSVCDSRPRLRWIITLTVCS